MKRARRTLVLCALISALAALAPVAAHAACTTTWLPTTVDGNWSTGTNWSSGSAPGATDDVCVPAGSGTITFDPVAASVRSLQLARAMPMNFGSTLTLTGSGTNDSQLTSPATVTGSATLALGAGAQLSKLGAGTSTLTVDINLDGPVDIDAGTLALGIGSDTTDSNAGNFTLADGTTFAIGVGGFGTHVFGGTVTDGANSATVTNASGNVVTFNGTYSVETTSNAGNLVWNGTTTPDKLDLNGAGVTLGGSADYTIADSLTWSAGIIGGSGTTTLAAGATVDLSGAGGKTLARTLNNDSTTPVVLDASGFSIQDPGLLDNRSGSTFRLSGDNDIGGGGDLASRSGSLVEKVGAGDSSLTTDIDFDGPVEVDEGSLSLGVGSDSVNSNAGNITLAQGTTFGTGVGGFGTHVFAGTVTDGANSATVTNGSGNLVSFNGAYSVATTSNSGNLAFNGTPSFGVLNLSAGTLGGSASWSASTFNWSGGSLGGSGTTTIPAGATFALTTATAKNVIDTRVLRNETTSFQPPSNNTLSIGGTARFDNAGTVTFADDRDLGGGGTVRNLAGGTLQKTGAAGGSSDLMLAQNAGTVSVSQGTLAPQTAYSQSGGQTVVAAGASFAPTGGYSQSGGTLRGSGTVGTNVSASGGTVAPGASPGTLTISGTYTQGAGATLQTEINGTTPGTGFDRLTAAGATLDGTLAIVNGAGFTPALTDSFKIVEATSVSGTFDTLSGATSGSRRYDAEYNPADVTLTVSAVAQPQPPANPNPKPKPPGNPILSPAGCLNTDATLRGKQLGPAKLGRKLADQRAIFQGANQQTRANLDRYCAEGGGNFRIGYPTPRLNAKLSKSLARKVKGRVVIVLTSSRRFSLAGIEVGGSVADARRKLAREKAFRIGSNTWYVAKRGSARLLVKTKNGRVGEIGIGDPRLSASANATKRFLNAWKLNGSGAALAAARAPAVPARFVVRGRPLARKGRVVAGRSINVFAKPQAVVVEGCRSRSPRVRVRRGKAAVAATVRCRRIPGALRLLATVKGATMRGTVGAGKRKRRFTAVAKAPRGKLLRGRASARALGAVGNVDQLQRHGDAEVSEASGGARIVRTEISLRLKQSATVGQVNAALESAGGRIAGSSAGSRRLLVAIPDPGTLAALDKLLAALARRPGIDDAARAELAATQELPPGFGPLPSAARAAEISHLLAMRMPAAWNARRAIRANQRPTLIVVDSFGNGALSSQVDATVLGALTTGDPNQHGYHVTGIAAANFANNGSPAGRVTGVFPSTSLLKVVDVVGLTLDAAGLRMRQAVTATPGRVVVNSSLGHQTPTTEAYAQQEGSDWAIDVRSAGFVNRMLHAASAGNSAAPATANSPWVSAALRSDLTDIGGLPAPALRNTLAVENLADTGAPAYESGCLGISSNRGGNLAAVGTNVFSHLLSPSAGDLTGTSMSSPQAAGLAEYLWSIAPDLTAPQLASAMIATGRPPLAITPGPCGSNVPSAPRLDAYAAVLSLDQPAAVTRATAPVRFAILDHNGDGAFDHRDIQAFVNAYRNPPSARNWSRADLNGDGFTGSSRPAALDLDPRGSTRAAAPSLGTVGATIEGFPLTFDERALTDAEVLCFYAYSGLYTGTDLQRRHDELETEDTCNLPGDVRLELDFPERVRRGQSNTLTVRAFKVDGTGSEVDQQGVHLELSASGGTIGAASGTTDAQGEFTTTATMAQNQSSITIDVTAFDHPGGDELADDSVTAQLLTDGSAVLDSVFAHIFVRGQPEDDDKDADTPNWTLTGASSGPGGNASVTASATYTQDGPTVRYTGFAELEAHAGSDPAGATAGYTSSLQVTVTGGPVGWRVQQRFVGTRPLSNFDFGCQVWLGTQRVSSTGSAGGILEEGTSTISHDCGGGVGQPPADPTIDGRVDFTVTIGP